MRGVSGNLETPGERNDLAGYRYAGERRAIVNANCCYVGTKETRHHVLSEIGQASTCLAYSMRALFPHSFVSPVPHSFHESLRESLLESSDGNVLRRSHSATLY